ncbi:MAG: tetratricopeptide repeat protein [Thermoplasmata archaeon]|nr:tetratricopeptide repeat protein [Thermoplasmata archaeon]
MARKRLLTAEEAVLLHLLDYSRYSEGDAVPIDITQAGISSVIGVRRSHVSISLDAAKARETVEEHLSRVKGEKRKRKCYFLTAGGKDQAREIQERVGSSQVAGKLPDGSDFAGALSEMLKLLDGARLPRAALLVSEGIIKLPEISRTQVDTSANQIPKVENFVGRAEELSKLEDLFSGKIKLLALTGMPGIGKTSLMSFAAARFQGKVFWYNITEWSSPRNISAHLADFLDRMEFSRLRRYLDAHEIPDLGDVRDILTSLPFHVILIFDDCHKSSGAMKQFTKMLASVCQDSPNLGIGLVSRQVPDVLDIRQMLDSSQSVNICLEPLDDESSVALLLGRGLAEPDAKIIAKRGAGHPLYLMLASDSGDKTGPENVEDMLAREIASTLSDAENEMLSQLSVFREAVTSDALVETQEDIELLEELENRSILSNLDGWLMHGLLKDYYYARQAPKDRESRHEKAAEFYNLYSPGLDGQVECLHHLFEARDFDSAVNGLISRGSNLLGHGYVDEVLRMCALIPANWQNPDDQFGIEFLKASAHDLTGNWSDASASYEKCLSIARELDDTERQAETLRRLGAIQYRKGNLQDAKSIFEQALGMVQSKDLQAELQGSLGVALWKLGDASAARKAHEIDLELSETGKNSRGISRALNNLGILDWQADDSTTALERYATALKYAEKIPDNRLIAILYSNMGDVHRTTGKSQEAKRYYERCLELAEDLKFNWQVAEAYRGLAQVMPEKRADYLSRALAIFERLGADDDAKTVREMIV